MPQVLIQFDQNQLREASELLTPKQMQRAMFQAVKRTLGKVRTLVKRKIGELTYLKAKYAERAIGKPQISGDVPAGVVTISRMPIPAIGYKTSASKRNGATVTFVRGREATRFAHGFKARARSAEQAAQGSEGHTGLFFRASRLPSKGPNNGKYKMVQSGRWAGKRAARFAIQEIMGPPVVDIVDTPTILSRIELDGQEELAKQMDSQVDRFLNRRKGGGEAEASE